MKYPDFLKTNGTIGFVAPSFGCNIEPYKSAFANAQKKFKEKGFKLDIGPNCYKGDGIGISTTPKACGKELEEYYSTKDNDVLISCGGGELMCETISEVDFQKIRAAKPKWYMGYSDNTNFTFLLTTLCDTASIYGPCAASFGMEPWHPAIEDAFALLQGKKLSFSNYEKYEKESLKDEEHPLEPYNVTEKSIIKPFPGILKGENIEIEGRMIGGCMDCLVNLLGTKYDKVSEFLERYKDDGFIWFLESCDLNVMAIRRAIWQMEQAGWFKYAKGFVVGRPAVHGQELMGLNQYHAITDILEKYGVPIVMDCDFGHIPPQMPVICGSYSKVVFTGGQMTLSMELK